MTIACHNHEMLFGVAKTYTNFIVNSMPKNHVDAVLIEVTNLFNNFIRVWSGMFKVIQNNELAVCKKTSCDMTLTFCMWLRMFRDVGIRDPTLVGLGTQPSYKALGEKQRSKNCKNFKLLA